MQIPDVIFGNEDVSSNYELWYDTSLIEGEYWIPKKNSYDFSSVGGTMTVETSTGGHALGYDPDAKQEQYGYSHGFVPVVTLPVTVTNRQVPIIRNGLNDEWK